MGDHGSQQCVARLPSIHASLGEAAADSSLESQSNDVIESTSFHPERSESMLKDQHRFSPLQSKAHPIDKHHFPIQINVHTVDSARTFQSRSDSSAWTMDHSNAWPVSHLFMLLWEKPLQILPWNRSPMTSSKAPVFTQRDQKACSKTSTGFPHCNQKHTP